MWESSIKYDSVGHMWHRIVVIEAAIYPPGLDETKELSTTRKTCEETGHPFHAIGYLGKGSRLSSLLEVSQG